MSDKYGYIGIETLLNFCSNDKNHCVTPNDFMRMNRVKIDERPHGEWVKDINMDKATVCSECGEEAWYKEYCGWVTKSNFCPRCGSDNRKRGDEK